MNLRDTHLVPAFAELEPCIGKDAVSARLRHREAHEFHGTSTFERGGFVRRQCLGHNLDGLVFQLVGLDESF